MSMTKRTLPAALLGSIALFLILAFLPFRAVEGRAPLPRQLSGPHVHAQLQNNTPTVIDGSVHPEMISDSAAYRLFFLVFSTLPNATSEDTGRQRDALRNANFNEAELQFANQILTDFRTQFDQLAATYNAAAEAAINKNQTAYANLRLFLAKRDALVQTTRDNLATGISPNSLSNLQMYVQREKSRMKVAID